jgi:hypothetical protein
MNEQAKNLIIKQLEAITEKAVLETCKPVALRDYAQITAILIDAYAALIKAEGDGTSQPASKKRDLDSYFTSNVIENTRDVHGTPDRT